MRRQGVRQKEAATRVDWRATTHNFPTNIVFQRNEIENEVPFICICNVIFFGGVGYLASQN